MSITIVGMGAGAVGQVTREAWGWLTQIDRPIYFRTFDHPVVAELPQTGGEWHSFDPLYAESADFLSVYAQITETILQLGATTDIVYVVPGHPHVGEATVLEIEKKAKERTIAVHIVAGLSFVEPTLTALQQDAFSGLQLLDAMSVAQQLYPSLNPDLPLLLAQVFNRHLASELKLALQAVYPPEHEVILVHHAGMPEQQLERCPLYAIDQSVLLRNLSSLFVPPRPVPSSLEAFANTIATLRSPQGCPWDREQTPQSLMGGLLEEAAEVVDALQRENSADLCEELGDLLLHVLMQCQMASESGDFLLNDVIARGNSKIIRRHPHVWASTQATTLDDHLRSWDAIKEQEKEGKARSSSLLADLPATFSALTYSQKLQKRVRKVGFDWPNVEGVWEKVQEELVELRQAKTAKHQSAELGDLLFVLCNLALWLGLDAEEAMRYANHKFLIRFQAMEQQIQRQNASFSQLSAEELDSLWREAKKSWRDEA